MGIAVGAGGTPVWRETTSGAAKSGSGGAVQKTAGSGKRKRLNYNYRAVSGRILRAKTSTGATQVVTYARTVVAMLRRKYGSKEYNDKDVEIAIIHAEKMVRIAKKKLKNLKMEEGKRRIIEAEEEKEKEGYEDEYSYGMGDMQQTGEEFNEEELRDMLRELENELRELAAENRFDELTDECFGGGGAMSEEDLERIKKKHRCDEMRQIVEADMKYLKAVFEHMIQEQQEMTVAATLELSAAVMNTPIMISVAAAAGTPAEGASVDASV